MPIDHCIDTALSGGEISKDDAERLKREFERFRAARAAGGEASADAQAKLDLVESLRAEAAHKRRQAKLALTAVTTTDADAKSFRTAGGRADIGKAYLFKLENFGEAPFASVVGRHHAILGMAHAKMEDFLNHFRRGAMWGDKTRWHKAELVNVLKEAFGEDSGDAAAKAFAKAWTDTAEWLRRRFNAAGGAIGKIDNWGLPQSHDSRAVRRAGLQAWKDFIKARLDPARMRHPLTGKPVDAAELDAVLSDVWETIAMEGWNKRQPSRQRFGRGALANQRAEHRFLVFRSARDWLDYAEKFGGGGDVFAAMMQHINMMSRDIAAMEILGPNPSGMVEWMKQALRKEAMGIAAGKPGRMGGVVPENALARARHYEDRLDAVWGSIRGSLEAPVDSRWARGIAAARSIVTASVLGAASLSSVSDLGTTMLTRKFAGMGTTGAVADLVKAFAPATRREAVQAGLVMDSALHAFHTQARYVGTLGGPEWASYIADRVLTWSGLTPWTQAAKHAFGLALMTEAGNRVGMRLDELPDALRNLFGRYGISAREWDQMRAVPLHQGQLLRPTEVQERVGEKLAEKWLELIQSETEYAVVSGSHRARTVILNQNQPGTFVGEVLRSFYQFKSFGAAFAVLHGLRTANLLLGRDTRAFGAAYAGALLVSTTLFGALGLQLKSIAQGRDPRNMKDPAFWAAALLQGGGLGIYGDFLFANVNRYGGGFSQTLGGPLVQRINDFWNLTAGNVIQLASGEKTNFGRELVKFMRGNVPGSNIWYIELAWQRLLMDQLQFLVDPEASKAFRRQQLFWRKQYNQGYWWAPPTMSPQRAPDLGAMAGAR